MRAIRELLIILKEYIENNELYCGLCSVLLYDLCLYHYINQREFNLLSDYIRNNRPTHGKHYNKTMCNSGYFWPKGEKQPRLDWLTDEINKFN